MPWVHTQLLPQNIFFNVSNNTLFMTLNFNVVLNYDEAYDDMVVEIETILPIKYKFP